MVVMMPEHNHIRSIPVPTERVSVQKKAWVAEWQNKISNRSHLKNIFAHGLKTLVQSTEWKNKQAIHEQN